MAGLRRTGTYQGQEAIKADIAHFKAALKANGVEEGFMTSVAPASAARFKNVYYKTDEEFMFAVGEAMREEYKAIVDAGLILQLDDPAIAENWDMINPEPSVEGYQKFTMVRIEALNHAIRGLPEDRIRFHLCWGSWHGPHTTDIPMRDIVDVMLAVKCQAYSFEAGNVRHEHEWTVWEDVKLPDGKIILPGVVSHATNVVEHPELVAQRILRFTKSVGRERVIAATDCGLGGRVHPMIAWAKLEALAQGAALASREALGLSTPGTGRHPLVEFVDEADRQRWWPVPRLRLRGMLYLASSRGKSLGAHPSADLALGLGLAEAVPFPQAGGQYLPPAVDARDVLVGQLDPIMPQLPLEDEPVGFDLIPVHRHLPANVGRATFHCADGRAQCQPCDAA